ncbi:hypothetical protein DFH06DRAFT_282584 [Mycena polygramma]|nr:hypothetical protein DFH06DRAFT_282584 [Mycena polygramma]
MPTPASTNEDAAPSTSTTATSGNEIATPIPPRKSPSRARSTEMLDPAGQLSKSLKFLGSSERFVTVHLRPGPPFSLPSLLPAPTPFTLWRPHRDLHLISIPKPASSRFYRWSRSPCALRGPRPQLNRGRPTSVRVVANGNGAVVPVWPLYHELPATDHDVAFPHAAHTREALSTP